MVRIKICGITRPQDGFAAAAAGADAIGLIFVAGSPRCIDPAQAIKVIRAMPPFVTPVGVFMDAPARDVAAVACAAGLSTVQLHGQEMPEDVAMLAPLTVIKGLAVQDESIYEQIRTWSDAGVAAILLDRPRTAAASDPAPMPWHLLKPEILNRRCGQTAPIILAGGLTPDNVYQAAHVVQPFGVDASSGVEAAPGRKDHNLIQRFVLEVRRADHPGVG